jgi:multidrug transporter EmrE-like cation transporter
MDRRTRAYFQLFLSALLLTAAELLLKAGAGQDGAEQGMNFEALSSSRTWLGIVFYVLSFVVWLNVLRTIPVGWAYAIHSVVQITVPIGALFFLSEQTGALRALGIVLVFVGMIIVAVPSAAAEQRL